MTRSSASPGSCRPLLVVVPADPRFEASCRYARTADVREERAAVEYFERELLGWQLIPPFEILESRLSQAGEFTATIQLNFPAKYWILDSTVREDL